MSFERWRHVLMMRLRSLFQRSRLEDELADEITYHIDERTRELMAKGLSQRDARQVALSAFGGVEQRKEECRDARGVRLLHDLHRDLTYACRTMRRSPTFTADGWSPAVLQSASWRPSSSRGWSRRASLALPPLTH